MNSPDEEELRRIREYLFSGRDTHQPEVQASLASQVIRQTAAVDEIDAGLRALGLNRREREHLRRGAHRPRPRNFDRERETALKRIGYYIDERVDWQTAKVSRHDAIAAWAHMANYDVDRVVEWWRQGVDPLDFAAISELISHDLAISDMFTMIHSKTVLQHVREGTSVQWCLLALGWSKKA